MAARWDLNPNLYSRRIYKTNVFWSLVLHGPYEALQLHGGYGYLEDYPIERFYRAAKILELYEGTREIDKMMIGRKILGVT